MLTLLLTGSACLALACSDWLPTQPRQAPSAPSLDLAAGIAEAGCARFEVRVSGRDRIEVIRADTVSCGPVQPVLAGTPEFDHAKKRVRLPIALENRGARTLRAPARLYGWVDSLVVLAPPGLAKNRHTSEYLAFLAPDSVIAGTAERLAGARVWRFDDKLSAEGTAQTLAAGARSQVRWVEVAVHSGVQRFQVTLRAEAGRAGGVVPAEAPEEGIPWRYYSNDNLVFNHPRMSGPYPRNVVMIAFRDEATQEQKQAAIDAIGGEVIGGGWGGYYYVRIQDDGTAAPLWKAIDLLLALPQVEDAGPDVMAFLGPA